MFVDNYSNKDDTFTKTGFTNFRKASNHFDDHSKCKTHQTANDFYLKRITTPDSQTIASQLDSQHNKKCSENRNYL